MTEPRKTDLILIRAQQELTAPEAALFAFYMAQYQPLCGAATIETWPAWNTLMTFLEERMHELLPEHTQVIQRSGWQELSQPAPRGIPPGLPQIKVWAITECDYWAGATVESCIAAFKHDVGQDADEYLADYGEPMELSDEQMNSHRFSADDGSTMSFRERLDADITAGIEFPKLFASSEY